MVSSSHLFVTCGLSDRETGLPPQAAFSCCWERKTKGLEVEGVHFSYQGLHSSVSFHRAVSRCVHDMNMVPIERCVRTFRSHQLGEVFL
mmetsp:Transcript_76609/g.159392  ORF Transcript_76609/g.159392 Transcript_76609/m.159392 type:complete len:89 (-) Transcript_76609:477-743(-)